MFRDLMSPAEIGGQIKAEYSKSSPKIRLSLIAYLLEYGIPDGMTLTEAAQEALDFVTADTEAFHELIDSVYQDPKITTVETTPVLDDPTSDGYL